MLVVVIGGTGLIGSQVVSELRRLGHEAVPASPGSGVDTLTGAGLADVLVGAEVVVDVSNSPSFEDAAALDFFTRGTRNLLAAEDTAGVRHHVALSVVGAERVVDSGYLRAKAAQETLIREAGRPWSVVRATQFFEFFASIARGATVGEEVHLSSALVQPLAAAEVALAVARVAVGAPLNAVVEVAGPDVFSLADFVAHGLKAEGDVRSVVVDPGARYFGALLSGGELLPGAAAQLGDTTFDAWLSAEEHRPAPAH